MPQNPYLVSGKIHTRQGTSPDSVVTINSEISTTTNTQGQYVLDLANLSSDWAVGSQYSIEAFDSQNNEYKTQTITVAGAGLSQDVYLESRTKENTQNRNSETRRSELRLVGTQPVSVDNPLSIQNFDRQLTQKMVNYSGGQPQYIGYAPPGTPTSEPQWLIIEMEYGDGTASPPTGRLYANGNSEFNKVWDTRSSYSYS